jgi:hypothetical protein
MLVSTVQLEYCLDKAREFSDYYVQDYLGTDDPKRYIENLKDICEKHLNVRITQLIIQVAERGSPVKGAFLALEQGEYVICVARDLNPCWQRFVFCKELFHVVMDRAECRDMNVAAHVEAFTVEFPPGNENATAPSIAVQCELLTEIAAMEFMFPYTCRRQELVGPISGNFLAIAEKYMVPRVHVEKYMSQTYMTALQTFCDN